MEWTVGKNNYKLFYLCLESQASFKLYRKLIARSFESPYSSPLQPIHCFLFESQAIYPCYVGRATPFLLFEFESFGSDRKILKL